MWSIGLNGMADVTSGRLRVIPVTQNNAESVLETPVEDLDGVMLITVPGDWTQSRLDQFLIDWNSALKDLHKQVQIILIPGDVNLYRLEFVPKDVES